MYRVKNLFLFLALTSILIASCDDPDPNEIVSDIYFQATVDGQIRTYQLDVNDYINIVGDFTGGQDAGSENQYIPFTCVANNATLANSGAIGIIITDPTNLNAEQVGNEVTTGTYTYGTRSYDAQNDAVEGAFVSWVDGAGTEWTTNGDQTGSTFSVSEYVDQENDAANTHKVISATFSCNLYNGLGGTINLTNGIIRGRMIVY